MLSALLFGCALGLATGVFVGSIVYAASVLGRSRR